MNPWYEIPSSAPPPIAKCMSRLANSVCSQTFREYEVLLALCKSAPLLRSANNPQSAQKLARYLIPHLMELPLRTFAPSPFFRKIEPSPTEALSFHIIAALLSLGTQHPDVQETVSDSIWAFIRACGHAAETTSQSHDDDSALVEDAISTATLSLTLLGFLEAACAQADFWKSGGRLALIQRLRDLLSQPFLVAIETAISTIRNASSHERHVKEWRKYVRHYEEIGRPLGAMLLQRSFMWLLVSTTSLLVAEADALKQSHILDIIMTGQGLKRPLTARSGDVDFRSVETYALVAIDQMNYLESSADFDMLSPAKERLAFAVKGAAMISFLNCSTLNEEAADSDTLMAWLEDALSDPSNMADEDLASVILKSIALICRVSPEYAASVSRLLPRFIMQSGVRGSTVDIASRCLAYVLRMLSKDDVITTLYTLGNVLSPGSDRPIINGDPGLDGQDLSQFYSGRQSTGSSISMPIVGDEENSLVQGNVVQAICEIARACKDEKITALAQSMLAQKLVKLNHPIDTRVITGAASLAMAGGQAEFRYLLKRYAAVAREATLENKEIILESVNGGFTFSIFPSY